MTIYSPGDRVIVKTKEQIREERGEEWRNESPGFPEEMDVLIGMELTVIDVIGGHYGGDAFYVEEARYALCDRWVEPAVEEDDAFEANDPLLLFS